MTRHVIACAVLLTSALGFAHASCAATRATVLTDACAASTVLRVTSATQRGSAVGPGICDLTFDKRDFAQAPSVTFEAASKDALYTVVMVDPDAPNHPPGRFYLHWIVANVAGSELAAGRVGRASVVTAYVGPGPPKNTGNHRYMFAVYEQGARAAVPAAAAPTARAQFDLSAWLRAQRTPLCGPVAGAQFRSHF